MKLDLSFLGIRENYWPILEEVLKEKLIDQKKIHQAYNFSLKAHSGQFRQSGEPFISHPVWVAKIIAQLQMGEEAIIASLLHDCVEDTKVTLEEIANLFGDEVGLLVAGLTEVKKKTSGIEVLDTNVDVFRKFLFSSVDDVRILIIRLADKLHNGLTIDSLSAEDQKKYAQRVLGIYAPVAEYVGLHYFKKRLEDIAFEILNPEVVSDLKNKLKILENDEIKAVNLVKQELESILKINNVSDYEIEGRIKSLYSTYIKIKKKGEDGVKDRVGLRVLLNSVADCYTVLGLLHAKYRYIPDEFDDYISSPKANGYRSIQTTVEWKKGVTVEIQIRTFEMHEFNEFGPASHIAYKLAKSGGGAGYDWVKDLIQWKKNDGNVNNYRINVLSKFIYVFTPKGDIIQLPSESTALDFAYRIHGDVGDHCSGAKINEKMAKINDVLKTGDVVEILTTKKLNVSYNWLEIAKTSQAKERIRKTLLYNSPNAGKNMVKN